MTLVGHCQALLSGNPSHAWTGRSSSPWGTRAVCMQPGTTAQGWHRGKSPLTSRGVVWGTCPCQCLSRVLEAARVHIQQEHPCLYRRVCAWWTCTQLLGGRRVVALTAEGRRSAQCLKGAYSYRNAFGNFQVHVNIFLFSRVVASLLYCWCCSWIYISLIAG